MNPGPRPPSRGRLRPGLLLPRVLALALAGGLGAGAVGAEEPPAEQRVRVALRAPRSTGFVGEVLTLTLELEVDEAWLAERGVPLSARRLDLPLSVVPGWGEAAQALRLRGEPEGAAGGPTLALGDRVLAAERLDPVDRAGRTFARLALRQRAEVLRPGAVTLPPPTATFAWAERFRMGLLGERVPEATAQARVAGEPLALTGLPPPEEGRPAGWRGAIGRFTLEAAVEPPQADEGVALELRLTVAGEGSHETLPAPDLGSLEGFHVLGVLDPGGPLPKVVRVSLVPLSSTLREVPAVALPHLDPGPPARYVVARSAPLPLEVRSRPGAHGAGRPDPGPKPAPRWLWAVLAALVLGLARAWVRGRRSRAAADDPRVARAAAAAAALEAALRDPALDLAGPLAGLLAARLGCAQAAVVGPGLARRLEEAGVAPEVAGPAAATLDRLVAARYGGAAITPAQRAEVGRVLRAFEAVPGSPAEGR